MVAVKADPEASGYAGCVRICKLQTHAFAGNGEGNFFAATITGRSCRCKCASLVLNGTWLLLRHLTTHLAQDVEVKLDDIVPPLANISPAVAAEMAQQPLIPLDVSGERQFFLSWRHGRLEVRCLVACHLCYFKRSIHGSQDSSCKRIQHAESSACLGSAVPADSS